MNFYRGSIIFVSAAVLEPSMSLCCCAALKTHLTDVLFGDMSISNPGYESIMQATAGLQRSPDTCTLGQNGHETRQNRPTFDLNHSVKRKVIEPKLA